jgi:hypothetical protein
MQIRIEIEVEPEELRRFLGLPDVAGIQEDVVHFLRDKIVSAGGASADAASFVKDNVQSLLNSSALRKIIAAAKATGSGVVDRSTGTAEEAPERSARKRPAARKRAPVKGTGRRSGAKATNPGAAAPEPAATAPAEPPAP